MSKEGSKLSPESDDTPGEENSKRNDALECEVIRGIQSWRSKLGNRFWKHWTHLGEPYWWIAIGIIAAFFWRFHVTVLIGAAGFSHLATISLMKRLYKRKRPHKACENVFPLKNSIKDHSFPSGHTYQSTVMTLSLALCYGNILLVILAFIFGASIAFSRIYIGVHYLTDVLIAYVIAVFFSFMLFLNFPLIMKVHELIRGILLDLF